MVLRRISLGIVIVVSLGIIVIGIRFLLVPEASAVGFGVADPNAVGAYFAAKGVRDIAVGLLGLGLLLARRTREAGWAMLALSVIAFGDMVIVMVWEGVSAYALSVHGGTAAAMWLAGAVLLFDRRRTPGRGAPSTTSASTAPSSAQVGV